MKRRAFLRTAALFGGSLLLGCSAPALLRASPGRKRFVIIGAGLSGLAIAWELRKKGHEVVLLEGAPRVGGRLLTERNGFLDGQFTEQGPTFFPDNHELTLGYIREFGLTLQPYPDSGETAYRFGGKTYWDSEKSEEVYPKNWGLTAEEDREGLGWIQSEYFHRGFPEIGDPRAPGWANSPGVKRLDALTYEQYLKRCGASKTATQIELAVEGSGGKRNSAAIWIAQAYLDRKLKRLYSIEGGNDLLAHAFASRLKEEIQLGAKVTEVVRENGRTLVRYVQNGTPVEIEADAVACTASPALIKKIRFSPGLSEAKQTALASVRMAPVTKVSMAMKERFWRKERKNNLFLAYADDVVERVWDMSVQQPGSAGLLLAYAQEDHSLELSQLPESKQFQRCLHEMEKMLPGASKNFVQGSSYSWEKNEWIGGAWARYTTNQLPLLAELGRPEGNLFFAGDHTSLRIAWMQGAFESAQRVLQEAGA